jgi:predicted PurR-regulated permease PerM
MGGVTLFEPAEAPAEESARFGAPGRPLSRDAPFFRGFLLGLGLLVALVLGWAVREVQSVLVLVLVAVFLAVGLNPLVELLNRRGFRRGWAVATVTVAALGVLALIFYVLIGELGSQVTSLVDDAPHLIHDLRKHKSIEHLDRRFHFLSAVEGKLRSPEVLERSLGGALNIGLSVLGALLSALLIFVMTVYLLGALPQIKRVGYSLVPASRRERVAHLGDEILRRVGGYVVGAVLVALLAGTVTLVLLLSVGLGRYALPLALFVGLLDLVPLVGSVSGAAVVTLIGFATSLDTGIACLIVYLVYEPIEGYVVYPRVMRSSVDVPEIVTIVAVLLGGALGGIVGALVALPAAAAISLLTKEVWIRRQNAM